MYINLSFSLEVALLDRKCEGPGRANIECIVSCLSSGFEALEFGVIEEAVSF